MIAITLIFHGGLVVVPCLMLMWMWIPSLRSPTVDTPAIVFGHRRQRRSRRRGDLPDADDNERMSRDPWVTRNPRP